MKCAGLLLDWQIEAQVAKLNHAFSGDGDVEAIDAQVRNYNISLNFRNFSLIGIIIPRSQIRFEKKEVNFIDNADYANNCQGMSGMYRAECVS